MYYRSLSHEMQEKKHENRKFFLIISDFSFLTAVIFLPSAAPSIDFISG